MVSFSFISVVVAFYSVVVPRVAVPRSLTVPSNPPAEGASSPFVTISFVLNVRTAATTLRNWLLGIRVTIYTVLVRMRTEIVTPCTVLSDRPPR